MINNRQAGRRRGRGGGNNGQRPGGGAQGNGSRIDSRARGNATQLYEKYKNMAADAQRAGDRVSTEYYLQFADHYFRVLSEQRGRFEDQQPVRAQRDDMDFDGAGEDGEEFGDEGEPVRARDGWNENGEAPRFEARDGRDRDERPRDGRQRDDAQRDNRPRDDRPRDERPRDDRPREFRRDENDGRGEPRRTVSPNANNNGDGRREWQERDRQERGNGQDRPRDRDRDRRPEASVEVAGQHRADAVDPAESLNARAEEVLSADRPLDAPVTRRRGRPPREAAPAAEEMLGFELPPAIASTPAVAANDTANDGESAAKPRRRRVRPADEAPAAE